MEKKGLKLLLCALAIGLCVSLANADVEDGLVAYWAFDDGGGTTAIDYGPNTYDGTLEQTPEWTTGPTGFGSALSFDAGDSQDGVYCGTECDPGDIFTLALWAYWDGTYPETLGAVHFLTKSNGWGSTTMRWQWELKAGHRLEDRKDKIAMVSKAGGSVTISQDAMPKNEWMHLAVTFDGSDATLFVNGVADPLGSQYFAISSKTDADFFIGRADRATTSRSFAGELDEVRVYNRVLSTSDLQELLVPDPFYNAPPRVDAGDYPPFALSESDTIQLDATVTDDGRPADPCEVTMIWSKLSGPGNVQFSDTTIEDPTATFDAAGTYELQLSGWDGEKDSCDVAVIYIRPDNNPIAHWDFDEGSAPVNDDSANNNEGTLAGDSEPNWVSGWVGSGALEFYGSSTVNSYVDITTDGTIDPNLDSLRSEISLSAWVKTEATGQVIIQNGADSGSSAWSLGMSGTYTGQLYFLCGSTGDLYSVSRVDDGYWHHVVGVYDGSTASIYVDGVLDASEAKIWVFETSNVPVTIGGRYHDDMTVSRSWNGMLDDVRVYGYSLSADQVAALADMGDLIPVVDAGDDQTFSVQDGYLQLDATVVDDGNPVAATLEWTQASGPGTAAFSDTAIEDPCVTFDMAGTYVLTLTADDTAAAISDEVTIEVVNPTCQDVIDDGLLIAGDFSGPNGIPDCRVDLYDFAVIAGDWLSCNDPQDPQCDAPY